MQDRGTHDFIDVVSTVSMSVTVNRPLIVSVHVSDASEPNRLLTEGIPEQLLQFYGLTSKDSRKAQLDGPTMSVIVHCLEAFDGRYLKE